MPTRALNMRKIRELIRLKYEARLSHEQIARALAISKGVVAKYVARVERAGLEVPALLALSDAEVLVRISPAARPARSERVNDFETPGFMRLVNEWA
jgi:DNA-binding Lrp family transcriptional regulator